MCVVCVFVVVKGKDLEYISSFVLFCFVLFCFVHSFVFFFFYFFIYLGVVFGIVCFFLFLLPPLTFLFSMDTLLFTTLRKKDILTLQNFWLNQKQQLMPKIR